MPEHQAARTSPPRVLMTLADVAWPVDAGRRLRAASMISALASRCDVDVVVLFADADPAARPIPPDVPAKWQVIGPLPRSVLRAALAAARHRLPWQIAVQDWPRVRRMQAHRDGAYDLVWFGALDHFCQLSDTVRAPVTVVDCDDVETEKLARFLALTDTSALGWADRVQRRLELPMWARIQRQAVRSADAVLVCSELDRGRLAAQAAPADGDPDRLDSKGLAARIFSVPNTYPEPIAELPRAPSGACTVVVIANFGTDQNLDAAHFAAHEVLPELHRAVAGARIRLVGRRPDRLTGLEQIEGLDIVGPVESVAAELAGAHLVLVPVRFGGGTRLKILEAMAYRVPIVSTRAGAEGIEVQDGVHLLLADTGVDLAAAALRLLTEPGLADRLTAAAFDLYRRKYRPQACTTAIAMLLDKLLPGRP